MNDPLVLSTPVQVRLFGLPALLDATGTAHPLAPAAGQLLAYLLLFPAPISRERLAETLWPEQAPGYARRRLSDALYRLRRTVDPGWLRVSGSTLAIGPHPPEVDLWAFERLATSTLPEDLEQAVALYQADLLADFDADWVLPRRIAVRESFLDALLRLGQAAEAQNQPGAGTAYFRRLADEDPLREEAYQGLMRCLARNGRHVEGLEAYSRLERLLDAELGLAPTNASSELAARIRAERVIAAHHEAAPVDRFVQPPFVGRIAERARLLNRLEQARAGRGGAALVLGEAGIGKSRLLGELAAAAAWRGWQIAGSRADETHTGGVLTEALAQIVHGPRIPQLARLVPIQLRAVAARIVPALAPNRPPPAVAGREQLAGALAAVLSGLGTIAPHLIILDDLHWAAPDLWPLLADLIPLLGDAPVLIVLAGRSDELRAQAAWQQIEAWEAAGMPLIPLSGLSPAELDELAQGSGFRTQDSRFRSSTGSDGASSKNPPSGTMATGESNGAAAAVMAQLYAASNGNPLIALTLLRADALHADAPPPDLSRLVERRMALLAPELRRAVQAAAVLGARVAYTLWEGTLAAAQLAPEQLPALAGELERRGFLVPEGAGYRFAHDTLRSAIYADLPSASRQRWHTLALDIARQAHPADPQLHLYHAVGADNAPAVAAAALAAGRRALEGLAPSSAMHFFTQALDALPASAAAQRYTAVLGRYDAAAILADTAAQQRDLAILADLAARLDDPQRRMAVLRRQVELQWMLGRLHEGEALAEEGLALAQELNDAPGIAALLEAMGRIARHGGAFERAEALFRQAQQQYAALNDRLGAATITDLLGGVAWSRGDYAQAAAFHAAAADKFQALDAPFHEARALNKLGSAYWGLGDFLAARATHERSLPLCEANGDRLGMSDNLDNLGGVAWVLGDYPTAIGYYERALALRRAAHNAWGISISLGNLGSAYRLRGDAVAALRHYDEALTINRTMGRRPGEGYVQHGRGLTFLDQGRLADAQAALEAAYAIRCELQGRDGRIDTCGALALVYLADGDLDAAQQRIDEALTLLRPDDRAPLRQWIHYVAFQVARAEGHRSYALAHLRQAYQAMQATGAKLPPPERNAFFRRVPLNRDVQAALDDLATVATFRLVRADTPLGRSLAPGDYVAVAWTLATPADELITPAEARRRTVIARLIAEAQAQGAAPTDGDLAGALGVSRRTILRDMAALEAQGVHLPTRRRKAP